MKRFGPPCVLLLVLTIVGSCSNPADTAGFDWPQWRGPDGNGQSRETEWDPASIANPRLLWSVNVGLGYSNVVIQNGWLYTVGMTKNGFTVSCLNAATGKPKWTQSLASSYTPQATPAVDGDDLYVLTTEGVLHALDSRSGKVRWRKDLVAEHGAVKPFYGFGGSPIIAGDLVILNANEAGMAVRRSSGALAWSSEAPPAKELTRKIGDDNGATYMTPVLATFDGRACVVVYGWKGLSAVEIETGKPLWTYAWLNYRMARTADPVPTGERILIADDARSVYYDRFCSLVSFSAAPPSVAWESSSLFCDLGTPVIIGGYIYAGHSGPYGMVPDTPAALRCLELETGRLRWEQLPGSNHSNACFSLAAASGTLIILDDKGTLRTARASPDGYQEIASCDVLRGAASPRTFWTPPVLCNAEIYCRNFAGDLVCIDVRK